MSDSDGVKVLSGPWTRVFRDFRVGVFGDSEVVRGTLHPHVREGDPELKRVLAGWPGSHYLAPTEEGLELVLVRPGVGRERPRLGLHLLLLGLTLFTTLMAGALLNGVDPLQARPLELGPAWIPVPTTVEWPALLEGGAFALTLLTILLAHELGHYVAARLHRIPVSLPYFIPFPAYFSIVGTLGAFIRLKGPTARRGVLFDVGASGPWVSFLISIPALLGGLALSDLVPGYPGAPFVISFAGEPVWIGGSLGTMVATEIFFPGAVDVESIALHPVAFAGWVGLFVTSLNLLPFGQLDGGHVLYALWGRRQRWIGYGFLCALVPLGFVWWGWWLWGGVAVFLSRGRIEHPPVLQDRIPLSPLRRTLAFGAILIFFLTFVPLPLTL